MIDEKDLQRYRAMSFEDKAREFTYLMEVSFALLADLPPDERRRRWRLWAEEDEESARALAEKLARLSP